jgi:hypothetical protein
MKSRCLSYEGYPFPNQYIIANYSKKVNGYFRRIPVFSDKRGKIEISVAKKEEGVL